MSPEARDAASAIAAVAFLIGLVIVLIAPRKPDPDDALTTFQEGFGCALLSLGFVLLVIVGLIWFVQHVRVTVT